MRILVSLWREWVSENPFLLLDLRRAGRRRRLQRGVAWWLAAAIGLVLFASLVDSRLGPAEAEVYRRFLGPVLLYLLSLTHLVGLLSLRAPLYPFTLDVRAARFDFLRVLPWNGRELMLRLVVPRSVLALLYSLLLLPVYALVAGFGGLGPLHVFAPALFSVLLVFHPPSVGEVTRLPKRGPRAVGGAGPSALPFLLAAWFLAIIVSWPVLAGSWLEVAGWTFGWLALPGPVLLLIQFLVEPQPFFGWALAPLWLVLPFWLLQRAIQVEEAARRWDPPVEGAAPFPGDRLLPALHRARTALLAVAGFGFTWQMLVGSGRLGALLGNPTPADALAAQVLLLGGGAALHALLARPQPPGAGWKAWAREARGLGTRLAAAAGLVAGAGLLGGTAPTLETALALARLAAVCAAALCFAAGWRALFTGQRGWDRGFSALLAGVVFVAPVAALVATSFATPGAQAAAASLAPAVERAAAAIASPGVQAAAAWSPVYAWLRLLPGAWPAPPPLSLALAYLLPLLAGLLLLALGRAWRPRAAPAAEPVSPPAARPPPEPLPSQSGAAASAAEVPAAPRRPVPSAVRRETPRRRGSPTRLEKWLARRAEAWDHPFVNFAVRRRLQQPGGYTLMFVTWVLLLWLSPGMFVAPAFLEQWFTAGGMPWWAVLVPTRETLAMVAEASVWISGMLLFFVGLGVLVSLPAFVEEQFKGARLRGQLFDLYLATLSDREMAAGVLGVAALRVGPLSAALLLASSFWCAAAALLGAGGLWLFGWLWAAATLGVTGAHLAICGFDAWGTGRSAPVLLAQLAAGAAVVAWGIGAIWLLSAAGWEALGVALAAAGPLVLAALLPAALRRAARKVGEARRRADQGPFPRKHA